jgi:hypothetical protein
MQMLDMEVGVDGGYEHEGRHCDLPRTFFQSPAAETALEAANERRKEAMDAEKE